MRFFSTTTKGVTLIEILVAIAIAGMMLSVVIISFSEFRARQMMDAAVEVSLSAFAQAHLDSISSRNESQYGIHLDNDRVTYFVAPTYATGTVTNVVYKLHPSVEIANISLNGGGNDIIFKRLDGSTSQYGTFDIRVRAEPNLSKTITINGTGATSI